jgi:hypothetical protein
MDYEIIDLKGRSVKQLEQSSDIVVGLKPDKQREREEKKERRGEEMEEGMGRRC